MEDGVKGGAIATIITATGSANAVTGPDCLLTRDVKPQSCPLTSSPALFTSLGREETQHFALSNMRGRESHGWMFMKGFKFTLGYSNSLIRIPYVKTNSN